MKQQNPNLRPGRFRAELAAKLPDFLRAQRWFGGKARAITGAQIVEAVPIELGEAVAEILFVEVSYQEGAAETYALPLLEAQSGEAASEGAPSLQVSGPAGAATFRDALWDARFRGALLEAVAARRTFAGTQGQMRALPGSALARLWDPQAGALSSALMRAEQSNTSLVYGDRLVLKFFRRLEEGINPDLEIGTFLTEKARFAFIPPVAGRLEYARPPGAPLNLAILQGFARNQGDAWRYTLRSLEEFWARVPASPPGAAPQLDWRAAPASAEVRERMGAYLDSAQLLGRRTAQLHGALASGASDPDFAPEEFTPAYLRSLCAMMEELARRVFALLRSRGEELPPAAAAPARRLLEREAQVVERFAAFARLRPTARRTRLHGDYHLGQVLWTGGDFVIIDFEGEPARSMDERRAKRSPLRDVAGMLRSFHYAAYAGLYERLGRSEAAGPQLEPWARWWNAQVSNTFLRAYHHESEGACYLPRAPQELKTLLEAYLLEKAVYELGYELNNRPDWVRIPLEGILQLLDAQERRP